MAQSDNLDHFAQAVALAELTVAGAVDVLGNAEVHRANIAARVAALSGERAAVIARRLAGDHHDSDGANLSLLDADLEGLAGLIPAADQALHAARTHHCAAKTTHANAKADFTAEESRLAIAAFDNHASHLVDLLAATLDKRRAAAVGLSAGQQNLGAVAALLARLDSILVPELAALRKVDLRAIAYTQHPVWKPSAAFHDNVWRLFNSNGRFA